MIGNKLWLPAVLVTVLVTTACDRPKVTTPTVSRAVPTSHNLSDLVPGRVVGRVTLDGEPVRYFGITLVENHDGPLFEKPLVVRDVDGRFAIEPRRGYWDIVIAGPGFARHVIKRAEVTAGTVLNVAVEHGPTITGQLTNTNGLAVPGATISIQTWGVPAGDDLRDSANNTFSTVSDHAGRFRIENVEVSLRPRISTVLSGVAATVPREIVATDTTLDLVMQPVGSIVGTVGGYSARSRDVLPSLIVLAHTSGGAILVGENIEPNGTFRFIDVPIGPYYVGVMETSGPRGPLLQRRVVVTAGQSVTATLTAP